MTAFIALAVLALAATTLLVFAGREFLRIHGFPPVRMRSLADLLHLVSLGYSALNEASNAAARRRMAGPRW